MDIINGPIIFALTYVKLYKRAYFDNDNRLFYNLIAIVKTENATLTRKHMPKARRGRPKGFKNKPKNNP